MKIFSRTSILFIQFCLSYYVQAQEYEFAYKLGGRRYEYQSKILNDSKGNLIFYGEISDTIDLNPTNGIQVSYPFDTSINYGDLALLKFDINGRYIWGHRIGSSFIDGLGTLAVDKNDNILISGSTMRIYDSTEVKADFDFGADTVYANYGFFMAKYDENANLLWVKCEGDSSPPISDITTDSQNNIYVVSSYGGTVDCDYSDSTKVFKSYLSSAFNDLHNFLMAKYDSSANLIWAYSFGNNYVDGGDHINFSQGKIFIAGQFSGVVDFDFKSTIHKVGTFHYYNGGYTLSNESFLACYDLDANLIWVKPLHSYSGNNSVAQIENDSLGNLYALIQLNQNLVVDSGIAASYFSSVYAPSQSGSNLPTNDILLLKLDSAGHFIWGWKAGGEGEDYAASMVVKNQNSIYTSFVLGPNIYGTGFPILPGLDSVLPAIPLNNLLARLDSSGNTIWLNSFDNLRFQSLSSAPKSRGIFLSGCFNNTIQLQGINNSFSLTSTNSETDHLITKFLDYYDDSLNYYLESSYSSHFFVMKNATGIEDISEDTFSANVFPNPTNDFLYVTTFTSKLSMKLYSMEGQLILENELYPNQLNSFNLHAISAGIYFLRIAEAGKVLCYKVIKQ